MPVLQEDRDFPDTTRGHWNSPTPSSQLSTLLTLLHSLTWGV